ncbi:hypothetical protein BU17DRAFT_41644 [Hysterangium stoloniferum]|nr:hypothetical protein BU17DRAFT_41644 [Hysterangium stoloniferum]
MASSSSHTHHSDDNNDAILFPKPPDLPPPLSAEQFSAAELDVQASPDPPPPYPFGTRSSRRTRTNQARHARRALHASDDSYASGITVETAVETETSPLLGGRPRAMSHASTTHSVHSIAQTVLSSSRTVLSLFQAEPDVSAEPSSHLPILTRARRYFRPLVRRAYYAALFHLLFINFPYELAAWIFLFVGTLTGTTLLITLPLGVILCFLDLLGARALARGEIALQTRFHGPLSVCAPNPPHPIFSRDRTPVSNADARDLEGAPPPSVRETSFLKLTFSMFRDPTSYQALFYFLVIKPGITLLIAIAILILVPPAFVLVVPAPAVLRAVRRVGIWQAELAIDALS